MFFFIASAALTEAEAWSEVTDAVWWRNCPRSEEKMVDCIKKIMLISSYGRSGSSISLSAAFLLVADFIKRYRQISELLRY